MIRNLLCLALLIIAYSNQIMPMVRAAIPVIPHPSMRQVASPVLAVRTLQASVPSRQFRTSHSARSFAAGYLLGQSEGECDDCGRKTKIIRALQIIKEQGGVLHLQVSAGSIDKKAKINAELEAAFDCLHHLEVPVQCELISLEGVSKRIKERAQQEEEEAKVCTIL